MNKKINAVAAGALSLALLTATPVLAESNQSYDDNGLRLGSIVKLFNQERRDDRPQNRGQNSTVVSAVADNHVTVEGAIIAVSGATLTVEGKKGAVYTVNTTNAAITGHENTTLTLAALAVNDTVKVSGTLTGTVIVASSIEDRSDESNKGDKPKILRQVSAGIVTAVNGATVVFDKFGATGTTSATTNAATKYRINGHATTSSALTVGSLVVLVGTTSATGSSLNVSIVHILTQGFGWLKHFWR